MGITINGVAWDLTVYLAKHGINADHVVANGWDDEGYDVFVIDRASGRPMYGNTGASKSLLRERKEWPSPEIPGNLRRIQNREEPIEPKPEKPAPKPKEEPKK